MFELPTDENSRCEECGSPVIRIVIDQDGQTWEWGCGKTHSSALDSPSSACRIGEVVDAYLARKKARDLLCDGFEKTFE